MNSRQAASRFGLSFDATNSNTFSDAEDQKLSYKFGSLSTDVEPILATARLEKGGAIDPVAAYRASGYRRRRGHRLRFSA